LTLLISVAVSGGRKKPSGKPKVLLTLEDGKDKLVASRIKK